MLTQPFPAHPQEIPYYTGLSFVIEDKVNLRSVKCLHCRQPLAPRQGRQYLTISVRLHGYLCPACQENSIAFDQLTPALHRTFDALRAVLRRDPLMGSINLDRIKTYCYRADLQALTVAQWFLDELNKLDPLTPDSTYAVIKTYRERNAQ
ncbi:MAG TPA: hypothetical protein PK530_08190 [Anaerolineales bacterium]|nr:hypothetical protein [Anaerolineales bacterium]